MITNFKIFEGMFFSKTLKDALYNFLSKINNIKVELDSGTPFDDTHNKICVNYGNYNKSLDSSNYSDYYYTKRNMPPERFVPFSDVISFKKNKDKISIHFHISSESNGNLEKIFEFILDKIRDKKIMYNTIHMSPNYIILSFDLKNYNSIVNLINNLSSEELEISLYSKKYNL